MGMGQKQFTVAEFSRLCGVSEHRLRRLDASGELVALRTEGGHRRYSDEQVEEAISYIKEMKLLPGGQDVIVKEPELDSFFSYMLGLVMADGTVSAEGQVQLEMKDRQIMDDVAAIMGVIVHPRKTRPMFQLTVPCQMANRLVEYGVCRRKSHGFDVPEMGEKTFGCFLRGLFDGDGSIRLRGGTRTVRFHGHPRAMAHVQATLLKHFGLYMPWVKDNRTESGMLETSRQAVVDHLRSIMYETSGPSLQRKKELFRLETEGVTSMGMG